jgi:hypothetical protein
MKIKSKSPAEKKRKKRWLVKEKFLKIQNVLNLPFTRILMPKSKAIKSKRITYKRES